MTEYGYIIVSGLANGAGYALVGAAFGLIFFVTGRFHFAFGLFYGLAGMLAGWLATVHNWPAWAAILVALAAGTAGGVLTELTVYRALDRRASGLSFLGVFIVALGLVTAGEAAMALIFNQGATFNITLVSSGVWRFGGIPVPYIKATIFIVCWICLVATYLIVNRSSTGRQMRAVQANSSLAGDYGIDVKRVFLVVFAVASFLGAVLGVLQAGSVAATPTMGDSIILYAIVVAFLGRGRSILALGLIGEALGVIEALMGYKFGQLWQSEIVFIILFAFVLALAYAPAFRQLPLRLRRQPT